MYGDFLRLLWFVQIRFAEVVLIYKLATVEVRAVKLVSAGAANWVAAQGAQKLVDRGERLSAMMNECDHKKKERKKERKHQQ